MKFNEGVIIENIINYIKKDWDRFLLICLGVSLPFDRIPSFSVFSISVRFSLIFSALIILRSAYLLVSKKINLKLSPPDKFLVGFIIWLAIIIPVSLNLTRALSVFIFTLFAILLAFSISIIFKKEYFKPLATALFLVTFIVVGFGIFQYFGDIFNLPGSVTGLRERYSWSVFGFPRIQSFSLEPLYMAAFLLLPYSLAATQLLLKGRIYSSKLLLSVIFLSSFAIFLSVSRGGIYAMILSSIVVATYVVVSKKGEFKKALQLLSMLALSFLLSLVLINYLNKTPSAFTQGKKGTSAFVEQIQKTSIGDGDERSQARNKALALLNENKSSYVVGIGPGQYGPYVQNNQQVDYGWTIVNNMPLEILLETGLVGLGLISLFFISLFVASWRTLSKNKTSIINFVIVGCWMYLISQAVQVQTYSTIYILYLWLPIGVLMAICRQDLLKNKHVNKKK